MSEVDPGQAGCPGAVTGLHQGVSCPVKTLHWKELEGLPGGVDTTREYPTGGSHLPHVPLLQERAVRCRPARSGMLCDRSGKDRTDHPLQVRSDTASTTQVFGRAIYQGTKYTNVPSTQLALTDLPAALCSTGALQRLGQRRGRKIL